MKPGFVRNRDGRPVESLQAVTEHGAVDFAKDVLANLNDEVGSDPDEVGIERCVMQLAQRDPVRDHRVATRLAVGDDVRSVEQFLVAELA